MSCKLRKAWRMRASAPSTNLLLAGSTPCMPATKMKSRARAPTLHVSFPVLIAPGGLSVLTPLGEGDWAKLSVVVQANTRPQETKQRANMAKPLPHIGLCTTNASPASHGGLAVSSHLGRHPGQLGCRRKTLGVKDAERCRFSEEASRLCGLQIARRLLAALGHDLVADLLAFHESAHAGALDRADVHEHVLAAVARLDEAKAFLRIEELHGTCGHHGLLALRLRNSDHASVAWSVIQFLGSWLGTVERERREADRKLVADRYLCERGRDVNPHGEINPAQAGATGNRRCRRGVECHRYRSARHRAASRRRARARPEAPQRQTGSPPPQWQSDDSSAAVAPGPCAFP